MRVPDSEVEVAAAWLLDRFPDGLEERAVGGAVELAVFTDDAGEAAVRDSFSDARSELVAAGWEDRWKEFHRPVRAGGLWIGPPWLSPPADELAVVVDPGRAFGTGAHATTRACIELLAALQRGSLLDAGCGSGVVAVAAARLGFAPVVAVDLDEIAVEVAALTARANDVEIDVRPRGCAARRAAPTDVLVANIELPVVERLLERLLARRCRDIGLPRRRSAAAPGWVGVDRLELEGWAADVFREAALS